jgi:hypothetical protein
VVFQSLGDTWSDTINRQPVPQGLATTGGRLARPGRVAAIRSDFAMLRLVLLALLPQIGGILLMISRAI